MTFCYDTTGEYKVIKTQEEFDKWIAGKDLYEIWVDDPTGTFQWNYMDRYMELPFTPPFVLKGDKKIKSYKVWTTDGEYLEVVRVANVEAMLEVLEVVAGISINQIKKFEEN